MDARVVLVVAVIAGSVVACETREAYPEAGPGPAVIVNVVNENLHDVDIYAIQGAGRLRIARLWAGESGDVELGPPLVEPGEFMLEVYAIGLDSSYRTPGIVFMGRMHIELRIERDLNRSTFTVSYGEEPDSVAPPTGETS